MWIEVSFDILIGTVLDRQTGAEFSADWVFTHSAMRLLRGKTITNDIKLKIVNCDALITMKFVSGRNTDIRDIFMLMPQAVNIEWISDEATMRCDFSARYKKIKDKIISPQFKDALQGVYGYVDKNVFEKHKHKFLEIGK